MDELKTKKSDKTCWPSNLQLACKSRKYLDESRVYIYSLSVLENARILIFSVHWQVKCIGECADSFFLMVFTSILMEWKNVFDNREDVCFPSPFDCLYSFGYLIRYILPKSEESNRVNLWQGPLNAICQTTSVGMM